MLPATIAAIVHGGAPVQATSEFVRSPQAQGAAVLAHRVTLPVILGLGAADGGLASESPAPAPRTAMIGVGSGAFTVDGTFPSSAGDATAGGSLAGSNAGTPVDVNALVAPEFQQAISSRVPAGRFVERSFLSVALGRTMAYYVYLPPGYESSSATYPVLYMLHGMSGQKSEWASYGLIHRAHELMSTSQIAPMIVVLPQGDESYWANHYRGPRWGDYLARDVVADVDARFRTRPDRSARAVGGLSMGGTGALQLALNYPDVFGIAGAHSASIRTFGEALPIFGDRLHFARIDPISIVESGRVPGDLKIWLDAGLQDDWLDRVERLHTLLLARGHDHAYVLRAGGHNNFYWFTHAREYLRFYSAAFQR